MYIEEQSRKLDSEVQLDFPTLPATAEKSLPTDSPPKDAVTTKALSANLQPCRDLANVYGTAVRNALPRRAPLVIAGSRRPVAAAGAHTRVTTRHRLVINASVLVIVACVIVGTLLAVAPSDGGLAAGTNSIFRSTFGQTSIKQNKVALIAAQAATATAVTQDGYEYNGAGGNYSWQGVQKDFTLPDGTTTGNSSQPTAVATAAPTATPVSSAASTGSTSGISSSTTGTIADSSFTNPFTPGQCTYWADYEYHHLTGYAVPWTGNAADWATNAQSYSGWVVSSQPRVPSIIVLQSGVQYAGSAGHVAVVEKINSDGSVATTNWNVVGWGVFSWATYHTGSGVSFIWHE